MDVGDGTGAATGALEESCSHGHGHGCERRGPAPVVIFDTDMDFDDAAALAYLCQQHKQGEIELRAVTVANNGAGMPGHAIRHARCILAECGLTDIPIADGSDTGVNPAPPELQFGIDAILEGTFATCTESTEPSSVSAAQLMVDTIRDTRRPVVLLTTGPLSNVAAALDLDASTRRHGPRIARRINRMYVMGGAVSVAGNLFGSALEGFDNSQEFNIWVDPPAAQQAFDELRQNAVSLVPLDATNSVPVTAEFVDTLRAHQETPEASLVVRIADQPLTQFGISSGAFFWWDPLAAVAAAGDLCTVDFERGRIAVVQDGPQEGRTIVTRHGVHMEVGIDASRERFERLFMDGLNGH
jgi:purine nucleosidase